MYTLNPNKDYMYINHNEDDCKDPENLPQINNAGKFEVYVS